MLQLQLQRWCLIDSWWDLIKYSNSKLFLCNLMIFITLTIGRAGWSAVTRWSLPLSSCASVPTTTTIPALSSPYPLGAGTLNIILIYALAKAIFEAYLFPLGNWSMSINSRCLSEGRLSHRNLSKNFFLWESSRDLRELCPWLDCCLLIKPGSSAWNSNLAREPITWFGGKN